MVVKSFPFNAEETAPGVYDRLYLADDYAWYYRMFVSDGLISADGQPYLSPGVEGGSLRTFIDPGACVINGYVMENKGREFLNHSLPEATVDRIDRIVLRLDTRQQSRWLEPRIVEGEPAAEPVPPVLTRTNFIYELSVAQVRIRANTSTIAPEDLIDERLDEALCGISAPAGSIPTEQLNQMMAEFRAYWDAFIQSIQDEGFASAEELARHQADDAADAHNATNISVVDTAGNFTAPDVEGALGELFLSLSNGNQSVNDGKTEIATAITEVDESLAPTGSDSFQVLADSVRQISTGKKWASGVGTVVANTSSSGYLEVTGLTFKPSLILMTQGSFVFSLYKEGFYNNYYVSYAQINLKQMETASTVQALVSETGFKIYLSNQNSKSVNWTAYE